MSDILDEREKTHGSYFSVSTMAQSLKDAMRHGKNWDELDDPQRESLEMIASKIGRILSGNPHDVDHWRDIAGYATLGERWLTSCIASDDDPTPHHGGCNPATPVPSQEAFVSQEKAMLP